MRGTKRFAASDSTPIFNSNDSVMQSKRLIMGSPFDAQRSEPSIQLRQLPPLDMQRAESSRQHVRALNTQFASWVQAQLEDHPDELWDDGVQDYLNHAKNIVEKFSDVVNWLKANAGKGESLSELGSNDAQKKPGFEIESKENNNKLLLDKPVLSPAATTANFGTSWSSGLLFSNNKPFTFGGSQVSVSENQNSVLPNHDASNDGDAVIQRTKMLGKTKAQVNFVSNSEGDDNNEVVARTFLMRTKTEGDRNKLAAIINEYAPID
ncbi:uncharacterized protein LOC111371790 [Olea europaea subsp. europaea]|uniref:Uncharacterized protein LOC111371790 n=1 Tax=Olea europaea subsp. europaea TaxID=158383 RepID=A0A8S0RJD4_OLEEU|nr:uncharacterized protein LOC111371790 [Olea europaea subsp. europaea]